MKLQIEKVIVLGMLTVILGFFQNCSKDMNFADGTGEFLVMNTPDLGDGNDIDLDNDSEEEAAGEEENSNDEEEVVNNDDDENSNDSDSEEEVVNNDNEIPGDMNNDSDDSTDENNNDESDDVVAEEECDKKGGKKKDRPEKRNIASVDSNGLNLVCFLNPGNNSKQIAGDSVGFRVQNGMAGSVCTNAEGCELLAQDLGQPLYGRPMGPCKNNPNMVRLSPNDIAGILN